MCLFWCLVLLQPLPPGRDVDHRAKIIRCQPADTTHTIGFMSIWSYDGIGMGRKPLLHVQPCTNAAREASG